MTNPDNFQYKDDQVVAKIAVDVPASALTDIDQIRERAANLRVEMEAIARANGDWLGSLQQAPQIAEQASQAYRNMITQLERLSYIQQEMGGTPNVGMQGAPIGGQGGGAQPYSTAAPAGYMDPFMGMPGTGMGMGMQGAQSYMQSMMFNDPRMFANMAAQRGMPVNPATLGLVGGAAAAHQQGSEVPHTGGGMGQGAPRPGAMNPQETQKGRREAAPPDGNQSGQSTQSEPTNADADPHNDAPEWQKKLAAVSGTAASIFNESRGSSSLLGGLAAGMRGAGAAADAAHGGDASDAGGWKSVAKGVGVGGMGLGGGLLANKLIQDAGAQIQQFRNLGSVRGGGAAEGLGYEMQARSMALNPFLSLEQSRSIMQSALRSGYTGKEFDTVTQYMAENLRDMNMSVADQAEQMRISMDYGKESASQWKEEMKDLKDLSKTGAIDLPTRIAEYQATSGQLAQSGMQGRDLDEATGLINEAFAGDRQLGRVMPGVSRQLMGNETFQMMMAQTEGMQGALPGEVIPRLQDEGKSVGGSFWDTVKMIIDRYVEPSARGDRRRGASTLQMMLQQYGTNVSYADAQALYDAYKSGKNPGEEAAGRMAQTEADQSAAQGRFTVEPAEGTSDLIKGITQPFKSGLGAIGDVFRGDMGAAGEKVGELPGDFMNIFGKSAQQKAEEAMADTSGNAGGPTRTEGTVSGQLTVTVDQNGKVSAPDSVQLSGTQRSVNSGYGSGTINNPPPGDSSYQHANTGWKPGG